MGTMETLSLRSRPGFELQVWSARACVAASLAATFTNLETVDACILSGWRWAKESSFVKHDSFEPILATLAFGFWIGLFRILDRFPILRRYKMLGEDIASEPEKSFLPPRHARLSGFFYLAPFFIFDSIYPRRKLPEAAPSFAWLLTELAAGIVLYDFVFFWIHLAIHKLPFLRVIGHLRHHRKTPLDATETVNHSLFDGSLQVISNIIALNLLRSHPLTRAVHNVVITYMLSEAHSGFDVPWMMHNVLPLNILGGPPAHEAHHRWGNVHYEQLLTYMDRLLGHMEPPSAGKAISLRTSAVRGACMLVLGCCAVATWRWIVLAPQELPTVAGAALEASLVAPSLGFGNVSFR